MTAKRSPPPDGGKGRLRVLRPTFVSCRKIPGPCADAVMEKGASEGEKNGVINARNVRERLGSSRVIFKGNYQ